MGDIFVELIYNAALLVTLSVLYGFLSRFTKKNIFLYKILVGLLFGFIAIAGMTLPVEYAPGVIYDGRSVILVLAGFFGGALPISIAGILALSFRIYLGGAGVWAGILTIVVSSTVGLLFRYLYNNNTLRISAIALWGIGIIAHILMLASQLIIRWPLGIEIVKNIWFPILVVFPFATLVIGILLRSEERRIAALEKTVLNERLFYTLSENSPVGIFRTGTEGNLIYANNRWLEMAGRPFKEVTDFGWLKTIHPDDRRKLFVKWISVKKNKSGTSAEIRIIGKNGKTTWLYGEIVPEFNENKILSGYIGTATDITERKTYEKALFQSEQNFRRSLDESPLGVRVISAEEKTLYANKTMLQISGSDDYEKFIRFRFSDLYTKESLRLHNIRKQKRIQEKYMPEKYEIEILNRKGKKKFLQVFRKEILWNGTVNFQLLYNDITGRKKAEQALKMSEKSLNEAEQIARMGNWEYDIIADKIKWSENCYRVYGFEPYSIEPSINFIISRLHPGNRDLFSKLNLNLLKRNEAFELEMRILSTDGEYKWIHDRIIPQFDNDRLISLHGVVMDIDDLKKAVTALQESELNYRKLFEDHSAAKIMVNPQNGNIIKANKAAAGFYGWTVEQLEKMNIKQLSLTDPEILDDRLKMWSKGKGNHFEGVHRLASGDKRNIEVFSSKIKFLGAECTHAIIHDVTEKKKTEERLKLLSRSVEQNPVSIVITDSQGTIEYVNPKFSEITGYSVDELIGKNPRILKSGMHSKEFYTDMWNTILSGNAWTGEIKNRKKNGEILWESVNISPIFNEKEQITNFIGIKEDITEHKKIIKELTEAKEKAEESERLKSAFLANMSHEIRTPLNAILGFTQMLTSEEGLSANEKKEYTSIINKSAEGLLQIISDILDISQLETGMLKIIRKNFVIQNILSEIYAQSKLKMSGREKESIELIPDMPDEEISIYSDPGRLVQIFMNLLNNSIKFTARGYIRFGIDHYDEKRIDFYVSDTGIGIPKEMQTSIFDRFRQADESTTRVYGGTGLGLSIVKSLIELLGGEVYLESERGKGTTFRFHIPR